MTKYLILGVLGIGVLFGQRTVGPEPGINFGTVPTTMNVCQFGNAQRAPSGSNYGKACPNFLMFVDTLVTNGSLNFQTWTYLPFSKVQEFQVKLNGGQTGYIFTYWATAPRIAVNVADAGFLYFTFNTYIPTLLLPHVLTTKRPVYVALDGFNTDYGWIGSINTGVFKAAPSNPALPSGWDAGMPQTYLAWVNAYVNFFNYAKVHAPSIRLIPHIGTMDLAPGPGWDQFKTIYANVPAIEHEWFKFSQVASADSYTKTQWFNKIVNLSWFANSAPPVFVGDPPTRIVAWGTALDNGDIHSALALYAMVKGPNTFFDLLDGTAQYVLNPSLWLGTANNLGPATSSPIAIIGSGGTSVLRRTFKNGVAYFNLGAGTQTVNLPTISGSVYTDWSGNKVTSFTISNGKGNVFLLHPVTTAALTGANLKGAVLPLISNKGAGVS